jgi:hypothetical protein
MRDQKLVYAAEFYDPGSGPHEVEQRIATLIEGGDPSVKVAIAVRDGRAKARSSEVLRFSVVQKMGEEVVGGSSFEVRSRLVVAKGKRPRKR